MLLPHPAFWACLAVVCGRLLFSVNCLITPVVALLTVSTAILTVLAAASSATTVVAVAVHLPVLVPVLESSLAGILANCKG